MTRDPYDKSDSVEAAFWCLAGLLATVGAGLIHEGVVRLWPLVARWLG